jgi:DNA-binding NarL/FixJ family response regulator
MNTPATTKQPQWNPAVLYACRDLLFATRIDAAARDLGLAAAAVRDADALSDALAGVQPPACLLVDLDLGASGLDLIARAREAAPDLRIVAFGPHVDRELLAAAARLGADAALPRSRFVAEMPRWLKPVDGRTPRDVDV